MSAHAHTNTVLTGPPELLRGRAELTGLANAPFGVGMLLIAIAAVIGYASDSIGPARFWHAYLLNAMFITTLALGGLFFVMVHHLAGGRWGTVVRRLSELVANTMWLAAVLFVPIAILLATDKGGILYPWADAGYSHPLVQHKIDSGFLTPFWFVVRMAVYFAIWISLSRFFFKESVRQDHDHALQRGLRLQAWSGPGIVLFALSINFASFDFLMSLSPAWFSTMFGVYIFSGSVVGFFALLILLTMTVQRRGQLKEVITVEHFHDLGKLLFGFLFFWGYIAFSQYLLIWYAAIPEETFWYAQRQEGPWFWVSIILLFGHLLIPFMGLLSLHVRRSRPALAFWAVWMLAMHWWDLFYIVMPESPGEGFPLGVVELLCLVGMLALMAGAVMRAAAGAWLVPVRDPRLPESLAFINH